MRNLDSNFNSKTISPRYADRLPGGKMAVTDSGVLYNAASLAAASLVTERAVKGLKPKVLYFSDVAAGFACWV